MIDEIRSTLGRFFCNFGPFLPFYPSNNLENQNFEKMEKLLGDITILHMCTVVI